MHGCNFRPAIAFLSLRFATAQLHFLFSVCLFLSFFLSFPFPSPSGPWSLMVLCLAVDSAHNHQTTSRLQRGKKDPGSLWALRQALATLPWLTLQMTDDH